MVLERLDVRLETEHRRKLAELAEREKASISEVVRRMIDRAYEAEMRERRLAAAERLVAMDLGGVPEPDELSTLLDEAHGAGDLR